MYWYFYVATAGLFVGYVGFNSFQGAGSLPLAFAVMLLATLILFSLRSGLAAWSALASLQNPFIIAFLFVSGGLYYASLKGMSLFPASLFSTGGALIGLAFGFLIYGYWNLR